MNIRSSCKILFSALAGLVLSTSVFALDAGPLRLPQLEPLPQQSQAAHLAAEWLTRFHYKTMPLDDAMSEKIFDQYLKVLDPEKMFFVQADIDQLSINRKILDDAMLTENLAAPFSIYNRYTGRAIERFVDRKSVV